MDTPVKKDPKVIVVERGVDAFEKAEAALDRAFAAVRRLSKVLEEGNAAGMVGALATMKMTAGIEVMAGAVMGVKAEVVGLHEKCTAIAIEHGVDVPMPRSGGGGR